MIPREEWWDVKRDTKKAKAEERDPIVQAAMDATDARFDGMTRKDIEQMAASAQTIRERSLAEDRLVLIDDGGPVEQIDPALMDQARRDA